MVLQTFYTKTFQHILNNGVNECCTGDKPDLYAGYLYAVSRAIQKNNHLILIVRKSGNPTVIIEDIEYFDKTDKVTIHIDG